MTNLIDTNPVRLYAVAVAAIALAAYFLPSNAWPLVIALVAAILGVGEGVRSQVWSRATHEAQMNTARRLGGLPTLGDDRGQTGIGMLIIVGLVIIVILLATGRL